MKLYDLRINGAAPCLNVPAEGLRVSWKIDSDNVNVFQKKSRIVISKIGNKFGNKTESKAGSKTGSLGNEIVFDTGVREDGESNEVAVDAVLERETDYEITVWAGDSHGNEASITEGFLTELAAPEEGEGVWIKPEEHISGWAPYMRTKFELPEKEIKKAILYGVGLGIGEFYINGQRTDDCYLEPSSTNYEKTILYRANDVAALLKGGANCLAVLLGEGFYSQSRVWGSNGMVYGDECVWVKLRIVFEDGTEQLVLSDTANWKYKYSPVSTNNIYAGEIYDSRLETPDFALPEGSEHGWGPVVEDNTPKGELTPCLMPPVRIIREIPCISYHCESGRNDGAWIFDLGENFAGIYEFRIPAYSPRGAVYVFRTAEALSPAGNLDHRSTGGFATQCIQQDIYIAKGLPVDEVYRPRFTYHGFRYVEVTGIHDFSKGYGTEPTTDRIKGLALSTDFAKAGSFCSDCEDLNRLDRVMQNTFRSNYHGYPEDCPAREKCGWLGDAEVVCNWGLYAYDMIPSYEKYMDDIRTTDEVYGVWQMIAPGKRGCGEASPLWGCAQIIIPYWMWKLRGDCAVVRKYWPLMQKWVRHEQDRANDFIINEGLGDWCPPGGNDLPTRIPVEHSSTMMFYEIAAKMAELSDAFGYGCGDQYRSLAAQIADAINRHFYDYGNHTYGYRASNGVALLLGFYPEGEREALLGATVKLLASDGFRMHTGIYGNKYLIPVLFDEKLGDEAMKYLFGRDATSFGTMLDDNGTSLWEDLGLNFREPDRSVGVASYNHPMHGGVLYVYYEHIAGIKPVEPGFRRFAVKPADLSDVNCLDVSYESPYGTIRVSYGPAEGGTRRYVVTVPANTTCDVEIEGVEKQTVGSGEWVFERLLPR
ncbi:MAG: family 78 glycoside hydrolase catalytic domain [Clostridia bacterium]|nr:family 78 glycoside hydrolase catalytic domain [Clostridia bacterium]